MCNYSSLSMTSNKLYCGVSHKGNSTLTLQYSHTGYTLQNWILRSVQLQNNPIETFCDWSKNLRQARLCAYVTIMYGPQGKSLWLQHNETSFSDRIENWKFNFILVTGFQLTVDKSTCLNWLRKSLRTPWSCRMKVIWPAFILNTRIWHID